MRAWGLAVIMHLLANASGLVGWRDRPLVGLVEFVLLACAVGLVVRPRPRLALVASGLVVVDLWLDAPMVGNHALLLGLGGLAILLTRPGWPPGDLEADRGRSWLATMRFTILIAYGAIAFSKLNTGYLDPVVSCGVRFAGDIGAPIGFDAARLGSDRALGSFLLLAVLCIELAIPFLLVVSSPVRRNLVVVGAVIFHVLVGLDPGRHFWDFTATLIPFYLAFCTTSTLRSLEAAAGELLGTPRSGPTRAAFGLGGLVASFGGAFAVASSGPGIVYAQLGRHLLWLGCAGVVLTGLVSVVRTERADLASAVGSVGAFGRSPLGVRRLSVGVLVPLLALLNGLTPYLEIKTAGGWNMYANLVTSGGSSNHLIVRRTFPVDERGGDLVRILATDDDELVPYVEGGWDLTFQQLRTHLAEHPDSGLTYERDGERHVVGRAGDVAELVEPVSVWSEKLRPFRSVDAGDSPRCQDVWLPAR